MRPVPSSPARADRADRADRGAALLVVIVSIAILTAIAVDLAYSTRVSLLASANARDELRAEYQARGGVQLSLLVLYFQKQLDGLPPAATAGIGKIQLWSVVPVGSDLTKGLFGAEQEEGDRLPPGTFDAKIDDEGHKTNAQMDAAETGGLAWAQLVSFLQLVGDARWDPLFDREDANGQRATRNDVAIYLHDWTDDDSVTSGLNVLNPAKPFEDAFGDENQIYSRGEDPYPAKNARFDSLDELFLVGGIDDAFISAFGKNLTVYPARAAPINVNTLDPRELLRNARVMADPPQQAKLDDPAFPADLLRMVSLARNGGVTTITPLQFAQLLETFGIQVGAVYRSQASVANGAFSDTSLVYRIRATGAAGAVERRVDAVVTFDPRQLGGDASDMGRLLHWREE